MVSPSDKTNREGRPIGHGRGDSGSRRGSANSTVNPPSPNFGNVVAGLNSSSPSHPHRPHRTHVKFAATPEELSSIPGSGPAPPDARNVQPADGERITTPNLIARLVKLYSVFKENSEQSKRWCDLTDALRKWSQPKKHRTAGYDDETRKEIYESLGVVEDFLKHGGSEEWWKGGKKTPDFTNFVIIRTLIETKQLFPRVRKQENRDAWIAFIEYDITQPLRSAQKCSNQRVRGALVAAAHVPRQPRTSAKTH